MSYFAFLQPDMTPKLIANPARKDDNEFEITKSKNENKWKNISS